VIRYRDEDTDEILTAEVMAVNVCETGWLEVADLHNGDDLPWICPSLVTDVLRPCAAELAVEEAA
jgi:phage baseplate assembly protein gpV